MKAFTLVAIVGAILITTGFFHFSGVDITQKNETSTVPEHVVSAWRTWKMTFGRSYGTDSEDSYRLGVFYTNYNLVNSKNSNSAITFTSELNKYADLSKLEFAKQYLSLQPEVSQQKKADNGILGIKKEKLTDLLSKDWSTSGAVSPVKDQGQCGSCWAFSATGALEGAAFLQSNYLWYFSEQQLVDCASHYGNNGCGGGLMSHAFLYTADKGIVMESEYAYTATDGTCKKDVEANGRKINSSFTNVEIDNTALVNAIAGRPVSVGIEADDFQFYQSGVFDDWTGCGTQLDHGVLAVGYGTDEVSGKMYWKIKNSWGASWGESGYFRLERKMDNNIGICGITLNAAYPTL